jgi:hypothetical protein
MPFQLVVDPSLTMSAAGRMWLERAKKERIPVLASQTLIEAMFAGDVETLSYFRADFPSTGRRLRRGPLGYEVLGSGPQVPYRVQAIAAEILEGMRQGGLLVARRRETLDLINQSGIRLLSVDASAYRDHLLILESWVGAVLTESLARRTRYFATLRPVSTDWAIEVADSGRWTHR